MAHRPHAVVQRDDGAYQIGVGDEAPRPFPTRAFAQSVCDEADPPDKRRRPPMGNREALNVSVRAAAGFKYDKVTKFASGVLS